MTRTRESRRSAARNPKRIDSGTPSASTPNHIAIASFIFFSPPGAAIITTNAFCRPAIFSTLARDRSFTFFAIAFNFRTEAIPIFGFWLHHDREHVRQLLHLREVIASVKASK